MITLLLVDGARHPFKLDSQYLKRRKVDVPDSNPYNLSVYKLKELILREWRQGLSIAEILSPCTVMLTVRQNGKPSLQVQVPSA